MIPQSADAYIPRLIGSMQMLAQQQGAMQWRTSYDVSYKGGSLRSRLSIACGCSCRWLGTAIPEHRFDVGWSCVSCGVLDRQRYSGHSCEPSSATPPAGSAYLSRSRSHYGTQVALEERLWPQGGRRYGHAMHNLGQPTDQLLVVTVAQAI